MNAAIGVLLAFILLGLIHVRAERTRTVAMVAVILIYIVYAYYNG
jgi:hypothetical protein